MRLNSLHLCNFRQHLDTRIEFGSGITGIIGPNGSGKSTILEAIAWALYGMPAARGTRDSIRSFRAAPKAAVRVELDFDLAGHRYLVARGLTGAELYLDGAAHPIANTLSGVTDVLRRRLGMSHDEFFNTYFTGQKELNVMGAMGPAERAQFLSRVLGYERLRGAQTLVRERRKTIVAEGQGLRAGMPDAETVNQALGEARFVLAAAEGAAALATKQRDRARENLERLTPRWEALQRERDAVQALGAELRVLESEAAAVARDIARLDEDLAAIADAREECDRLSLELEPLAALQRELQELDRACNEVARRGTLQESIRALDAELAALETRRAAIADAPARETGLARTLEAARAELEASQAEFETLRTDWVRDRQEAETKRLGLLNQLRDVSAQREQIVELGENGICPTCGRPLGTHFRAVLESLDSQLETITVDGKYFRARIDQLHAAPEHVKAADQRRREAFEHVGSLERLAANAQSEARELTTNSAEARAKQERRDTLARELDGLQAAYDAARHREVQREVARLTPVASRVTRLGALVERDASVRQARDDAVQRRAAGETRVAALMAQRGAIRFSEEEYANERGVYEAAAAELRNAELTAVAAGSELLAAQASLAVAERAKEELSRTEDRLRGLVNDRKLHDELDRAFTDLRTDLNQQLRPEISDRASRYLRELTDGRYAELELDDQYNVLVLEDAIPKQVISGGEEDLANLVLRLAISEMIAERAGQAFSILILDEVFGSLDEVRRLNVIDLLRRLEDRFEQVILITHVELVREGLDHMVSVRYDEESGSSRVIAEASRGAGQLLVQEGAAD
jgi:exonuclease SbcC